MPAPSWRTGRGPPHTAVAPGFVVRAVAPRGRAVDGRGAVDHVDEGAAVRADHAFGVAAGGSADRITDSILSLPTHRSAGALEQHGDECLAVLGSADDALGVLVGTDEVSCGAVSLDVIQERRAPRPE